MRTPVSSNASRGVWHQTWVDSQGLLLVIEGGLRDGKAAASGLLIDTLEEAGLPPELTEEGLVIDVELTRSEAETWMRAFTDIRLALATRLGVEAGDEDYWHALPDDDPRAQAHDIYEWVGYLQETVVEALTS